jgi:hypothetical protein
MKRLFHWAVVTVLILVGIWGLGVYGDSFRSHTAFFLILWALLPVIAQWIGTKRIRTAYTVFGLEVMRNILTGIAVAVAFGAFTFHDRIRDAVGHRFVDGYSVTYYEDTDDSGRPYRASEPHTAHWYSRLGLWSFECFLLGACGLIPAITWTGANNAVKEAVREGNSQGRTGEG